MIRWWIWRSRIGSKSDCILRPATLDEDAKRYTRSGLDVLQVRTYNLYLAVFHIVHVFHDAQLNRLGLAAAGFHVDVFPADSLALESGTVSCRNRNFGDRDFETAHLDGLGHDVLVRNVGNDVFVGAHAGGENLRNGSVGYSRESIVDNTGCSCVPFVADVSKRKHECKHAVLVVNEDLAEIAR